MNQFSKRKAVMSSLEGGACAACHSLVLFCMNTFEILPHKPGFNKVQQTAKEILLMSIICDQFISCLLSMGLVKL